MRIQAMVSGVLVMFLGTALLYLAGAFVAGNFDSTTWSTLGKAMMLLLWLFVVVIAADVATDGKILL